MNSSQRQRQINNQRLNGLAEPVPVNQHSKDPRNMKYSSWPSETTGVPMEKSFTPESIQMYQQPSFGRQPQNNSVKSLLQQPTRNAALTKNKRRNESSNWMTQQGTTPENLQQMNFASHPVQSFVDDKIDYSAYEMGKKNFQNFVSDDTNLPAGAYYDTPLYIDPTTGKAINFEAPSPKGNFQNLQTKILEVNGAQSMQMEENGQQMQCNNPNCTSCKGN